MRLEYLGEKELTDQEKKIIERVNLLKEKMSKSKAERSERKEQEIKLKDKTDSS